MSVRYEFADAGMTSVTIADAGEVIGADVIQPDSLGVVFSYDEVFVLEGTREELTALLVKALARVIADEVTGQSLRSLQRWTDTRGPELLRYTIEELTAEIERRRQETRTRGNG